MNRLTKKDRYGHFYTNKANCRNIYSSDGKRLEGVFFANQVLAIDGEPITKLGMLEDIEEEIGIELITLFKALKNGIYVKQYGKIEHYYLKLFGDGIDICITTYVGAKVILNQNDYGKTWALTEEELL